MASRSLGTLTLDLVAKIGGFTGPLDKASRQAKRQMGDIAGSVKTAATAITGIGAVALGAAASVVVLANNAATSAREIKNLSTITNSSVEQFQKYAYGAKSVGIEQDKLGDIFKDTNDKVGDFLATGGGELQEFFEQVAPRVGITAEAFRNLSGPEALQLFYDSLEKANLSQAEMTFYLESIADDATRLIPLLRDGGERFAEMAAEADRLGIVLSDLDIAKLSEFAAQFDRITGILSSSGQVIAAELAPYVSVLADYFVESADAAGGLSVIVHDFVGSSLEGLGKVLDAWRQFEIAITTVQWLFKKVEVASDEMANAIWQSLSPVIENIAALQNVLIDGFQALGVEIENVDASSFLDRFPQRVAESKQELWELSWALHDLENSVPPSEMLDKFGEDVTAKVESIRKRLEEGGPIVPPQLGLPNSAEAEAAAKAADKLAQSYQALYDRLRPVETLQREYAEARALIMDVAPEAEQAALLDDLEKSWRSAENAAEVYGFTGEASMDKINDAAQELGFTFESAFENAIIEGQGFRQVLGGIAEDIARIALRKSVSEPFADWLGTAVSAFAGGFGGGSAGAYGGGSVGSLYADGGYTGPGSKMDPAGIVHAGEFVVKKSVVDQPGVLALLSGLNRGYAEGGLVGGNATASLNGMVGRVGNGGGAASIVYAPEIHVTASPGATEQDGQRLGKGLDAYINGKFAQLIQKEQRPGGMLAKR